MKHKQNGFAHWFVFLAIVAVVVFAGLFVLGHQKSKPKTLTGDTPPSGLADCSGKSGILKYSPVALKDLATVVPLGNFAPPGHVIPTVHMYYTYKQAPSHNNTPTKTTLYVPADMTVTKISLEDNASSSHPFTSYRVDFSICNQISGYFYHPITLNDKLIAVAKAPWDQTSTSFVGNGYDHNYSKKVNVKLKAGEVFGTGGGFQNAPDGLDFGLADTRSTGTVANTKRWQAAEALNYVCSLDYYPANLSTQLYSRIGDFSLKLVKPGNPKCGTVYQDVAGTAQGVWLSPSLPATTLWDGNGQLALVHSNYNHSLGVFSMGNDISKAGLSSSSALQFQPKKTGKVNLDFNLVKPDSIYCYNTEDQGQYNLPAGPSILLQLTNPATLKIGKLNASSCGSGPWTFSKSTTYIR